jgi:hypothetical protein
VIGNFEMAWDTGEVRFRTAIDIEGGELTATMWRNLVHINLRSMDRYLPGLTAVANGASAPTTEIARAQSG